MISIYILKPFQRLKEGEMINAIVAYDRHLYGYTVTSRDPYTNVRSGKIEYAHCLHINLWLVTLYIRWKSICEVDDIHKILKG